MWSSLCGQMFLNTYDIFNPNINDRKDSLPRKCNFALQLALETQHRRSTGQHKQSGIV